MLFEHAKNIIDVFIYRLEIFKEKNFEIDGKKKICKLKYLNIKR